MRRRRTGVSGPWRQRPWRPVAAPLGGAMLAVGALAGCSGAAPHEARASPSAAAPSSILSSPSPPSPSSTATPTRPVKPAPSAYRVVALGDSVPSGYHCGCTPYVSLYAGQVQRVTGVHTTATDDAVAGAVTDDVLDQLKGHGSVAEAVANADFVLLEVGANDVAADRSAYDDGHCGGDDGLACFRDDLPAMSQNLAAILRRVRALTSRHPVAVRVVDYWNVFEDGDVGRANGRAYLQDSARLTRLVDDRICAAATSATALCVRTTSAFKDDRDVTSLLAADGDHPNAAGHRLLATLVEAAGYAPVVSRRSG